MSSDAAEVSLQSLHRFFSNPFPAFFVPFASPEDLFGELWLGQGLCKGLDMSLHEVVVLGLITCVEVGFVSRVHLLFGEVRSVTTTLKVVEEVREEVQEIERE